MREMFWQRVLALGRYSAPYRSVPVKIRMLDFHATHIGGVVKRLPLHRRASGRAMSHIVYGKKRFRIGARFRVLAPSGGARRYGLVLSAAVRAAQNTHAELPTTQGVLPLVAKRPHSAPSRGMARSAEAMGTIKANGEESLASHFASVRARVSLAPKLVSGHSLHLPQGKPSRRIAARNARAAGIPPLRRQDVRQDFREKTAQRAHRQSVVDVGGLDFQSADAAIAKSAPQSEGDRVAFGTGESRRRLAARRSGSGVDEIKQPQYLGCSIGYC